MKQLILLIALSVACPAFATTYYVCAATGSPCNAADTNLGTSKTATWLHAPGMVNCTSHCNTTTLAAGDSLIFRGGDTWHFGNSGASPYTGGQWTWGGGNGSAGNPIYVGVDLTWFAGASFARPIFTGDNGLTPNPGTWGDFVASCSFQIGSNNNMFLTGGTPNLIFDNFEETGICQNDISSSTNKNIYNISSGVGSITYKNMYIHGWSHLQFSCTPGSPPVGHCFEIMAFQGGSGSSAPVTLDHVVVDGSDSDPGGAAQFFVAPSNILNSVFRYVATGSTTNCHVVANVLWDFIFSPADNEAHGDTLLCVSELSGINVYYNFVISNNYSNGVTQPAFWIGPSSGTTDYVFNDLWYANDITGQGFNIQNIGGGNVWSFNNTMRQSTGGLMDCQGTSLTHSINNHFITDSGSAYYGGTCGTLTTNLLMTNATATSDGYTASQTYAYSPTSAGSPTVAAGTNEQSICTTLSASGDPLVAAAGTACQSSTGYACTYNQTSHTVSCPALQATSRPVSAAWDIGAYEYPVGTPPPGPGFGANVGIGTNIGIH